MSGTKHLQFFPVIFVNLFRVELLAAKVGDFVGFGGSLICCAPECQDASARDDQQTADECR